MLVLVKFYFEHVDAVKPDKRKGIFLDNIEIFFFNLNKTHFERERGALVNKFHVVN